MYHFTSPIMMVALALGFTSAQAAPQPEESSIVVRFADLDVSSTEGAMKLYRRLDVAAQRICAPLDDRELARHRIFTGCVQNTIGTAVAKVNQPALTAYYITTTSDRNAPIQIAQR
jgi:UrcA family protein